MLSTGTASLYEQTNLLSLFALTFIAVAFGNVIWINTEVSFELLSKSASVNLMCVDQGDAEKSETFVRNLWKLDLKLLKNLEDLEKKLRKFRKMISRISQYVDIFSRWIFL